MRHHMIKPWLNSLREDVIPALIKFPCPRCLSLLSVFPLYLPRPLPSQPSSEITPVKQDLFSWAKYNRTLEAGRRRNESQWWWWWCRSSAPSSPLRLITRYGLEAPCSLYQWAALMIVNGFTFLRWGEGRRGVSGSSVDREGFQWWWSCLASCSRWRIDNWTRVLSCKVYFMPPTRHVLNSIFSAN